MLMFKWAIVIRLQLIHDGDWAIIRMDTKMAVRRFTLEVSNLFTKATTFIPIVRLFLVMDSNVRFPRLCIGSSMGFSSASLQS